MRAKIIGTGSFLPEYVATNEYLSTLIDTNDEWIQSRTGIKERHLAKNETTVSMATKAAGRALENANISAQEIDLLIIATVSGDYLVPSTACMVQKEIQAVNAVAFDINAACSGFLFALNLADAYFQTGNYKTALIIGVETLSKIVDWKDRSTCVLFGDGAGAAVLKASTDGLIASIQGSDGLGSNLLCCPGRPNQNPLVFSADKTEYLSMNGQDVFKFAVKKVPECILEVLRKANLTLEDIDCYVLHQANLRIISSISRKLQIPLEKFPTNVEHCGNTSAASVPILLDEIHRRGMLMPNDTILLAGFGAGLTWAAAVLTW